MLENRQIVIITLGYIIGILTGLYCKISIVLLYILIFIISQIIIYSKRLLKKIYYKDKILLKEERKFRLISAKRFFRYIKIVITKKVFIIIILVSIISNSVVLYQNNQYQKNRNIFDGCKIEAKVEIVSNVKEKKYKNEYKAKIKKIKIQEQSYGLSMDQLNIPKSLTLKGKCIYLNINKSIDDELEYGDIVSIKGLFKKPQIRTNYKAFDYGEYLKILGIVGTIDVKSINKKSDIMFLNIISKISNKIFLNLKDLLHKNFEKDVSSILEGIVLGYTNDIEEETKEDFSSSNISHVLAVSGMHIGYIILLCKIFTNILGKRKSYFLTIVILILYMFITGMHPSAVRATIMAVIMIFSKLIYRKNDIWTSISLSLLIMLIYNPFLIKNTGLLLSYMGTIGIIIYAKYFKIKNKIGNIFGITISVWIFILPILATIFNQIPILNIITSSLVGIIIAPIMLICFVFILCTYINNQFINIYGVLELLRKILSMMVNLLLKTAHFISNIKFGSIKITTPKISVFIAYYILVFTFLFIYIIAYKKRKLQNMAFKKRIRNLMSLLKYRYNQNKRKVISIILIFIITFLILNIIPNDLNIYFIDVGQGDSCLVVTPQNKKVLIDGGGSETSDYNVGKNILLPYLYARGIKEVDYIFISHFDTDHVGGILYLMQKMKVNKIFISKQFEENENLEEFKQTIEEKKINVQIVKAGDSIIIEKNLFFNILWPSEICEVSENAINNNSIVCKMTYKSFSMLFTGDIEEPAEDAIVNKYEKTNCLNSNILKVAHHGSKSSSINSFLKLVSPRAALIGVGANNNYGHPGQEVLDRLQGLRYKNL